MSDKLSTNTKDFDKTSLINFDIAKDMLTLSTLVYNFNIDLHAELLDQNKYNLRNIKTDNNSFSEKRKEKLNNIIKESPKSELYNFYDLPSGTQVGITISHAKERISIIFRGSNQLKDWLHDFLICKQELDKENNIFVHLGFYKSLMENKLYDNLEKDLLNLINKHPSYYIYISGHSLGGGLSTLFSYMFCLKYSEHKISLITFASPRVGNPNFANNFNNLCNLRHFRFVNEKDLVTSIPYVKYCHCGNCILLTEKNPIEYTIFDTFVDKSIFLLTYNPFDHFIENYYNNLEKCKW